MTQVKETTEKKQEERDEEKEEDVKKTRRAAEEEDEATDAVLNHVIVERFNWSGARSTLRWREDEINQAERWDTRGRRVGPRGVTKEVREGRTAFVRVATWIRRSRGLTEEDRCEGGRCFCPTSNTFQDGNVLAKFLRNGHSTHSPGARARTHGPRIQAQIRAIGGRQKESERQRKRETRRRRRRRRMKRKSEKEIPIRLASVAGPLLSYVGDEKAQL